ncbi:UbiA prenyltransferase family protein [bacterium]|nr:UbiA prenyltransferase family protein [bacterium]
MTIIAEHRKLRPPDPPGLTRMERLQYLFLSMRPLHWIKNIFVFVALLFSHRLFDWTSFAESVYVFCVFCLASSTIYIVNDIFDRTEDANHPSKWMRPITRGLVKVPHAVLFSAVLGSVSILLAFTIGPTVVLVILSYLTLNLLYSFFLKKIAIIDVGIIGLGFVFRVLAGAAVLEVDVSNWILISTFFLATLVALCKRRYEVMSDHASVHFERGYSPYFLDMLIVTLAASVIGSYIFYVISRGQWQNGIALMLSVLSVFYGVIRYLLIIYRNEEKLDHTRLILSDKPLVASVLIWIGLSIIEMYYINPNLRFE